MTEPSQHQEHLLTRQHHGHEDCLCAGTQIEASSPENANIKHIHELDNTVIKEPISKTWVLNYSIRSAGTGVRALYTKEMS